MALFTTIPASIIMPNFAGIVSCTATEKSTARYTPITEKGIIKIITDGLVSDLDCALITTKIKTQNKTKT